jgi:hypothetical protein
VNAWVTIAVEHGAAKPKTRHRCPDLSHAQRDDLSPRHESTQRASDRRGVLTVSLRCRGHLDAILTSRRQCVRRLVGGAHVHCDLIQPVIQPVGDSSERRDDGNRTGKYGLPPKLYPRSSRMLKHLVARLPRQRTHRTRLRADREFKSPQESPLWTEDPGRHKVRLRPAVGSGGASRDAWFRFGDVPLTDHTVRQTPVSHRLNESVVSIHLRRQRLWRPGHGQMSRCAPAHRPQIL